MIDAAVAAFSRGEYHTVRVDEIAEEAGTSEPRVYHHLGSKEGIFAACVRREADRLVETIRGAVHDPRAPRDGGSLHRGMLAFFTFVTDNRDGWTVLYRRAGGQGEPFAGQIARARERVTSEITDLIVTCTAGTAPGLRDAQLLARIAVSAADTFTGRLLEHPEETPHTMAGHVTALTWSSLGADRVGASAAP